MVQEKLGESAENLWFRGSC